mmetsp:Transcript_18049/g.37576  ORF Transcript_18049/g.37576 Transcript_18049/m.37576 type:complete len:304 (-) Transcript_18049:541-1452(-)
MRSCQKRRVATIVGKVGAGDDSVAAKAATCLGLKDLDFSHSSSEGAGATIVAGAWLPKFKPGSQNKHNRDHQASEGEENEGVPGHLCNCHVLDTGRAGNVGRLLFVTRNGLLCEDGAIVVLVELYHLVAVEAVLDHVLSVAVLLQCREARDKEEDAGRHGLGKEQPFVFWRLRACGEGNVEEDSRHEVAVGCVDHSDKAVSGQSIPVPGNLFFFCSGATAAAKEINFVVVLLLFQVHPVLAERERFGDCVQEASVAKEGSIKEEDAENGGYLRDSQGCLRDPAVDQKLLYHCDVVHEVDLLIR